MDKKYRIALSLSLFLHTALAVFLLVGDFSSKHTPLPEAAAEINPIQAVAIDKSQLEARVNEIKKKNSDAKAEEQKRLADLEKRADEAKEQRAKEQEAIKKLEKQREQKEAEKKKADLEAKNAKAKADEAEKVRQKKVAEQKEAEKAAADAQTKRIAEEKAQAKAAEIRKQQEAEKKRQEREAKERALQEAMLAEQMAAEMANRQQARSQQVMSETNRYHALISQAINRSVLKDKATMSGKSCTIKISITSKGFITNVTTGQGDPVVCHAAKTGVLKLGTLPMSENPDVYNQFKTFEVEYIPDFN